MIVRYTKPYIMSGNTFYSSLLQEWTKGLLKKESLISVFTHIRDIPYAIVPDWNESEDIIRRMITENKGWCGPKHQLLSWMLEQLGFMTRYRYIPFRWQDQPIDYPESITILFPELPSSVHLCLEVFLTGEWKLIDATWDPLLKRAGFPVNTWDGVSDTIPAVCKITHEPNLTQISHDNQEVRITFVRRFNAWLESIREEERYN